MKWILFWGGLERRRCGVRIQPGFPFGVVKVFFFLFLFFVFFVYLLLQLAAKFTTAVIFFFIFFILQQQLEKLCTKQACRPVKIEESFPSFNNGTVFSFISCGVLKLASLFLFVSALLILVHRGLRGEGSFF